MIDSYERRVFLAMVGRDERSAATRGLLEFGKNSWRRFIADRRFLVRRLPVTCRCGHTCPGPFVEMHDCQPTDQVGG